VATIQDDSGLEVRAMRTLPSDVARCCGYIYPPVPSGSTVSSTAKQCSNRHKCLRYLTPPRDPKRDVYMLPNTDPCTSFMEVDNA
jgi:hypothetical protein